MPSNDSWGHFWEKMLIEEKIALYAFAPFFQTCGALLRHHGVRLPPYRARKRATLIAMAMRLEETAFHFRQGGLGWMARLFPGDSVLFQVISRRWFDGGSMTKEETEDREVIAIALDLLFLFRPVFKRYIDASHNSLPHLKQLDDVLETVLEIHGSYYPPSTHLSSDALCHIVRFALYQECAGLAYQQALVQDGYQRDTHTATKKEPRHTDEELVRMAQEIGVDVGILREALSRTYSPWWEVKRRYEQLAQETPLPIDGLDVGTLTTGVQGYPSCYRREDYVASESVTKLALSLVSSHAVVYGSPRISSLSHSR